MNEYIFDEISARVIAFMHSDSDLLLERIHVGGGKTTNTLKTLEDVGFQWIYLAPFHTVIEENIKFSQHQTYNYLHLKSRAIVCPIDAYREIARENIDIRPICENSCQLKDTTCPYYETKRQLYATPISWAGVHHHLKDFVREFFDLWCDNYPMHRYYDVLVIDENPINMLYDNFVANPEMLGQLRTIIINLQLTHPDANKLIALIDYFIANFHGPEQLNYQEVINHFRDIDWSGIYDEYQKKLVEELRYEKMRVENVPIEYIRMFKNMNEQLTLDKIPYMIIKKPASPYNKKLYHFLYFENSVLLNCPIKIIGLDGTANIDIWQSITGRTASILDRKYIYNNIYQLRENGNPSKNTTRYARYPLSSWIRHGKITTTGLKLCALIDKICSRKSHNVLIACTKTLKPFIEENIQSKNIVFCNYYFIRSRNEFYETCDTIILACEANVQQFQLECFSRLSNWDQEIWRQIFTQEEMIQTVGRNRENIEITELGRIRDEREAYIFPYTPLTNDINDVRPLFSESHVVSYMDLFYGKHYLKQQIIELIRSNGYAFIKDVQCNFKIARSFSKDLLLELESEGVIVDEGRKGFRLYY